MGYGILGFWFKHVQAPGIGSRCLGKSRPILNCSRYLEGRVGGLCKYFFTAL